MEYNTFLIKYAEIGTKGKNRYKFEDHLCKRMRQRLKALGDLRSGENTAGYLSLRSLILIMMKL